MRKHGIIAAELIASAAIAAGVDGLSAPDRHNHVIRVDEVEIVLGKCSIRHPEPEEGVACGRYIELCYVNVPYLLIWSDRNVKLGGIAVYAKDGIVDEVDPSFTELFGATNISSIMKTEIDPWDIDKGPVKYFESIVVSGIEEPMDAQRRSFYGQVLLLAYRCVELNPETKIKTLSCKSDIVRAIIAGFHIPESSMCKEDDGRVLPSELWRLALESIRGRDQKSESSRESPMQ